MRALSTERHLPHPAPPWSGRGNCPESGRFVGPTIRWHGELWRDGMCPLFGLQVVEAQRRTVVSAVRRPGIAYWGYWYTP